MVVVLHSDTKSTVVLYVSECIAGKAGLVGFQKEQVFIGRVRVK